MRRASVPSEGPFQGSRHVAFVLMRPIVTGVLAALLIGVSLLAVVPGTIPWTDAIERSVLIGVAGAVGAPQAHFLIVLAFRLGRL